MTAFKLCLLAKSLEKKKLKEENIKNELVKVSCYHVHGASQPDTRTEPSSSGARWTTVVIPHSHTRGLCTSNSQASGQHSLHLGFLTSFIQTLPFFCLSKAQLYKSQTQNSLNGPFKGYFQPNISGARFIYRRPLATKEICRGILNRSLEVFFLILKHFQHLKAFSLQISHQS